MAVRRPRSALVVEEDAGRHERPGETSASGLVGSRHETDAKAPVECDEPAATACRCHAAEDND